MAEIFIVALLIIGMSSIANDPHEEEHRTLEVCLVCGRIHTEHKSEQSMNSEETQ